MMWLISTLLALYTYNAQAMKGSQHYIGKQDNYKDRRALSPNFYDVNSYSAQNQPESYRFAKETYDENRLQYSSHHQPRQYETQSSNIRARPVADFSEETHYALGSGDPRDFETQHGREESDTGSDVDGLSSQGDYSQRNPSDDANQDYLNTAAVGSSGFSDVSNGTIWKVRDGDICNLNSFPLPGRIPSQYFECLKPTSDDDDANWPWQDIGIWHRQNCTYKGYVFSPTDRVCKRAKSVRRSQQPSKHPRAYPAAPYPDDGGYAPEVYEAGPVEEYGPGPGEGYGPPPCDGYDCPHGGYDHPVIPRPCPLAKDGYGAQPGGICSWMLDPLANFGGSYYYYLQCTPYPPGLYCGRWIKRPCAHGTRFDVTVQVCVHDENPAPYDHPYASASAVAASSVSAKASAVAKSKGVARRPLQTCTTGTVPIGECNKHFHCPGYSTCQIGIKMCCQTALVTSNKE